jgi:hypothetical protein
MDQTGLPTNGDLTIEIKKAITRSIFLFIFVGKSYPRSEWCGKELQLFSAQFVGERKRTLLERTWIIILERDAIEHAKQLATGSDLGNTDAIFVNLFDNTFATPFQFSSRTRMVCCKRVQGSGGISTLSLTLWRTEQLI